MLTILEAADYLHFSYRAHQSSVVAGGSSLDRVGYAYSLERVPLVSERGGEGALTLGSDR
eukprot:6214695-Pleurochrysis_carterae.AAC.5